MNLKKVAEQDASNWARAEMFFGAGAGTRRKLLEAEIGHKVETITGYHDAFEKAYSKQNFADHAIKAAKERQRLDRAASASKSIRAIARGDMRGVSTTLIVIGGAAYLAHHTETGQRVEKQIVSEYRILEHRARVKYAEWKLARTPRES